MLVPECYRLTGAPKYVRRLCFGFACLGKPFVGSVHTGCGLDRQVFIQPSEQAGALARPYTGPGSLPGTQEPLEPGWEQQVAGPLRPEPCFR